MKDSITSFTGDYRWLSNFWKSKVIFDDLSFPTVENAYQSAKERSRKKRRLYMQVSALHAKRMGNALDTELREDWEDIKVDVMKNLVQQKFSHSKLKSLLLATNNLKIVYGNDHDDIYWGVCNGEGMNMLGKIIMFVRKELRRVS